MLTRNMNWSLALNSFTEIVNGLRNVLGSTMSINANHNDIPINVINLSSYGKPIYLIIGLFMSGVLRCIFIVNEELSPS